MPTTVQTISKEELKEALKNPQTVQVVNVLRPESYSLGLIPNSVKIPNGEIEKRSSELDSSKKVVTYCRAVDCHASREAAEKLSAKGFDVVAYEGGIEEWKSAGYPVEIPGISDQRNAGALDRPSGLSGLPSK